MENCTTKSLDHSVQASVLTESQCKEIFQSTLRILEHTGCLVENENARNLLEQAGCPIDGQYVKIPSALVEKCLSTVPKEVTIYNQDQEPAALLSARSQKSYFCPGVSNIYRFDLESGERRKAIKKDVLDTAVLVEALPNFDFACGLASSSDCSPELANTYEVQQMLKGTRKPMWISGTSRYEQQIQFELCAEVAGGMEQFREKPFVLACSASTSPLTHTQDNLDIIMYIFEQGIPAVYLAAPMMSATAPATLAGTLAVGLADNMTGMVLSQLVNEGTPFIACCLMDMMDARTLAFSHTGPEFLLGSMAACDIFKYLNLPFVTHFGTTDSPVFDQQAAFDLTAQLFSAKLLGSNFNFFTGFLETCMNGSLEILACADEMIGYFNKVIDGVSVNDETLAEDVIDEVGPKGSFLAEEHTMDHYTEHWKPSLFVRENYTSWQANGAKDLKQRANERVKEILARGVQHPLSDDTLMAMEKILAQAEIHIQAEKERR